MSREFDESRDQRKGKPATNPQTAHPAMDGPASIVESLQRTAGNAALGELLSNRAGASVGEPLPPTLTQAAERKLGADLSSVRVHSDADAAQFVGSLGAQAATVGREVYLGSAASDLASTAGRQTLLHELVHAAQAPVDAWTTPRAVAPRGSGAEVEARQIAAQGLGGAQHRPAQTAAAGTAHLKTADPDDEKLEEQSADTPAQASPTAAELLNPAADDTDRSPKPGESGDTESVVYEITVMQPLRDALAAVENQDWDVAMEALQKIGFRLLDYQNAYEKRDPMLYTRLMSARGWLGVLVQQLDRRLGNKEWSDDAISSHMRDDVGEFEKIEALLH